MALRGTWVSFILLLWVGRAAFAADSESAPPPGDLSGWHLLWNDEFDGAAIDPAKWRVEDAGLVKNNEMQYYSPEDVFLRDGMLVLRAQKRSIGGRNYSSGLVETRDRFAMTYGRYEFRAKMPAGQGFWPAVWMLPADHSWPPEIDILELVGSQSDAVTMTLHYGDAKTHEWDTETYIENSQDYMSTFHTFALEWDPAKMSWYVDGVVRYSVTNHVPQKPCYLVMNLAVGGDMPGEPDETTPFPSEMLVDYARIYGREVPGTFFLTTASLQGHVIATPWKPRYEAGDTVALKAVPSIGYLFAGWSGDIAGSNRETTVTMDRHRHVEAIFAPDPHAPALLSRGKPATASSVEESDKDLTPANAIDGDRGTRWSSKFSDNQWLSVDLGAPSKIQALRLEWENAYAKSYDVQVSDDGKTWKTFYSQPNCAGGTEEVWVDAAGRYVRVLCKKRATEWGNSLFEFEVFGTAD